MTIWEKMDACFDELSPKEKEVYYLIKKDPFAFASATAMDLSAKFGISQSSISRFCKRLGFNGYSDFRFSIYSSVSTGNVDSQNNSLEYHDYLANYIKLIAQTADYSQLDRIIEKIFSSQHLFFSGYGNSGFPALIMAFNLMLMNYNTQNIPASQEVEYLRIMKGCDILFLFSSGNPSHKDLISTIKTLPKDSLPFIVLVTNTKNHPFKKNVDEVIVLPDQQSLNCPYYIDLKIIQIDFVNLFVQYLKTKTLSDS